MSTATPSTEWATLAGLAARGRAEGPAGRFAPSPSGPLHLGNARTALLAWLQARLAAARFMIRIDDLDTARAREDAVSAMLDDLRWLGIDWDEGPDMGGPCAPYVQSQRLATYDLAFTALRDAGLLFRCWCSRRDIRAAASAPHGPGGPVYPGTCREGIGREPPARPPAWRYRVPRRVVEVDDEVAGRLRHALHRETGDFVVRRGDGVFAYQLAIVVDDALTGTTTVVRGADLLGSTPRQVELFTALGMPVPAWWHVPLLHDAAGQRMAKRDGSDSVRGYRDRGGRAEVLVGELAAGLGLAAPGASLTARELLQSLDGARLLAALRECAGRGCA